MRNGSDWTLLKVIRIIRMIRAIAREVNGVGVYGCMALTVMSRDANTEHSHTQ